MKQPMRADPEQKYRTLYEFTSDAVMLLNERNFFDCNPATLKMFGCATREQFLGKHPSEFSPESQPGGQTSASLSQQRITTALREGTCRFEWQHCRLDGTEFPAEVWLTAMDLSGEKVLQAVVRDITERKRAEQVMRESQQRFQGLVETLSDRIWEVDQNGAYTYVSPKVKDLLGYEPKEVLGKTPFDLMPSEEAQRVAGIFGPLLAAQQPLVALENTNRHKDGHLVVFETNGVPFFDAEGRFKGYRGTDRDITERKQAEEELQEREEKYRTILETIQDGYYEVDIAGNLTFFNDSLRRLYGYSKDELMGMNYRQYMDDETAKAVYQIYNTVYRTGKPSEAFGCGIIRKDGTRRFVQVSVSLKCGATGEPVGFQGIMRDATERQRAEDESRAARQQLLDIIDFLPDATFVIDQDRKVIAWNRAAEEMTGTRKKDILGQGGYAYALPFWGERRPILVDFIQTEDPEFMSKYPSIQKKGDTLYTEVFVPHMYGGRGAVLWATASPLLDSEGNQVGAIESVRDVTERKRAQETLQESEQRFRVLAEAPFEGIALSEKGVFVDLNDQLASMLGYARNELIGMPLLETVAPESRELVAEAIRSGRIEPYEHFAQRKDGTTFPVEVRAGITRMADHQLRVTAVRDITERKRAEEESRAARQRLLDIIDFLPDATFVIDQDKKVIAWNRAAEEMTGTRKEDILGQGDYAYAVPWWGERRPMVVDLIGMEDSEFRAKYDFVQKIGSNTLYAEVFVPRIFGGRGGYLAATAAPLLDSAGNMVGAIESVRDITERKRLERQIQESLARRGVQVQTSTEIAQEIATAPALDEIFRRVVTLIKEHFGYYHTQIFRYEPALNAMLLVAGHGKAGEKMLAASHRLEMGRGVVGTAAATGQTVLAADVMQDHDWKPNPNLPDTKGELAVPIKLRGQVLGILDVQSDRAGALTAEDQLLLEGLCGQIAVAMEDTRLRQETEERLRELTTLYRATSREGWEAFWQAAELPSGYLFDRTVIQPAEDLWTPEIARAVEQQRLVSSAPSQVAVSNVQESPNGGAAVAPLSVRGEVVGALGVYDDPQHPMSSDDLALVESVSEQVALALESARLFEQTQAALSETRMLNDISARFNVAASLEDVLEAAASPGITAGASSAGIWLFESDASGRPEWMEFVATWVREGAPVMPLGTRIRLTDFPSQKIWLNDSGQPTFVNNTASDERVDLLLRSTFERTGIQAVAFMPLVIGSRWVGITIVSWQTPHLFTASEQQLYKSIAAQAAVAIENRRLLEQTRARAEELAVLNEMSRTLSAMLDRDAVIKSIYQNTSRLMDTTNFYIALYDPRQDEVSFPFYAEGEHIRALSGRRTGKGLTEYVIRTREPLLIEENVSARCKELGIESIGQESQSWLGTPMSAGDQVMGVMAVQSYTTPRLYNKHHRDLLYAIASQAAVVLENTRLFNEARTRAEELTALNELSQRLSTRLDMDQVLQETYRGLSSLMDTTNFYIALYDPEKDEVSFPINASESVLDQQITVMPADQGMTGYIIRNRSSVLIKDNVTEWHKRMEMETVGEIALSWLGVPLIIGDQILGVMAVQSYTTPGLYGEHDRELLSAFANQTAIAIQNARLFEQTRAALAEVEATHQRYLREQWKTFLTDVTERALGYVDGPDGLIPAGDESLAAAPASATGGLAVPIRLRGEPIGVLEFSDKDAPHTWSEDERDLVEALADQAALALENARLFEETQSRARREQLINEITARVRASTNIETILRTAAEELTRTLNLPRTRIRLGAGDTKGGSSSD